MIDYLNQQWHEGWDVSEATCTRAAWVFCSPQYSRKGDLRMPRVSRALTGGAKLDPCRTRVPLPLDLVAIIADRMIDGYGVICAVALLVLFFLYLRPIERAREKRGDMTRPMAPNDVYVLNVSPEERGVCAKIRLTDLTVLFGSPDATFWGPLLAELQDMAAVASLTDILYLKLKNAYLEVAQSLGLKVLRPSWY